MVFPASMEEEEKHAGKEPLSKLRGDGTPVNWPNLFSCIVY